MPDRRADQVPTSVLLLLRAVAGFRRYDRICETLLHELAHMRHSEHDNAFKELNSQVCGLGMDCDDRLSCTCSAYYLAAAASARQHGPRPHHQPFQHLNL